jgi:hypothetical protein
MCSVAQGTTSAGQIRIDFAKFLAIFSMDLAKLLGNPNKSLMQAECAKLGLATTGSKDDLFIRLQDYQDAADLRRKKQGKGSDSDNKEKGYMTEGGEKLPVAKLTTERISPVRSLRGLGVPLRLISSSRSLRMCTRRSLTPCWLAVQTRWLSRATIPSLRLRRKALEARSPRPRCL